MDHKGMMARYARDFALSMLAYAVILVASITLLGRLPSDSPLRIPLALAPVIPVMFLMNSILQVLLGIDELQQRIQLFALGFAAGATGLLTFSYGFLENIGLPHLSPSWVLPILILFWGLGQSIFARRYS